MNKSKIKGQHFHIADLTSGFLLPQIEFKNIKFIMTKSNLNVILEKKKKVSIRSKLLHVLGKEILHWTRLIQSCHNISLT
ncbi:hypothetical protein BpHYR1_019131 [Brachionus plicatilis]|uniref:Uncharacterized protein n=1 Tax=Brachionus plicatilis TaxID=10195 RepID=A0A3M7RHV7_BRAPC|nr:hypothetical protein BpHYR1_019131 [Brachionus plicatilis]